MGIEIKRSGYMDKIIHYQEELTPHMNNTKTLVYVSLAAIALTLIMHLIFSKYRFVKYIPGLMFMLVGLYTFYQVIDKLTYGESLSSILLFIILFIGGVIGVFFALIIGIYTKPKKFKKTKKKDNTPT